MVENGSVYEYKVRWTRRDHTEGELDAFSKDGWRLVAINIVDATYDRFVLERERADSRKPITNREPARV